MTMKQLVSSLPLEVDKLSFITDESIIPHTLLALFHNPKAGAVVLFSGDVRNNNKDKEVQYLEYEAYQEMAEKLIAEVLNEAIEKWNLITAFCQHRIGKLLPSECAVLVITVSKHRKEAYEANQFIIDTIKRDAPIWKKEFYIDGKSEWKANDIKTL